MSTTILLIILIGIIAALAALIGIIVSMRNFARSNRETVVDNRLWQSMLDDDNLAPELKEALVKKDIPQAEQPKESVVASEASDPVDTKAGGTSE